VLLALKEKKLPGAPVAARAALLWAQMLKRTGISGTHKDTHKILNIIFSGPLLHP